MSSGGQRASGECQHGHYERYNDRCKDCRIEGLEREVAAARAERDAAVNEAVRVEGERCAAAVERHAESLCKRGSYADYRDIIYTIRRGE